MGLLRVVKATFHAKRLTATSSQEKALPSVRLVGERPTMTFLLLKVSGLHCKAVLFTSLKTHGGS